MWHPIDLLSSLQLTFFPPLRLAKLKGRLEGSRKDGFADTGTEDQHFRLTQYELTCNNPHFVQLGVDIWNGFQLRLCAPRYGDMGVEVRPARSYSDLIVPFYLQSGSPNLNTSDTIWPGGRAVSIRSTHFHTLHVLFGKIPPRACPACECPARRPMLR